MAETQSQKRLVCSKCGYLCDDTALEKCIVCFNPIFVDMDTFISQTKSRQKSPHFSKLVTNHSVWDIKGLSSKLLTKTRLSTLILGKIPSNTIKKTPILVISGVVFVFGIMTPWISQTFTPEMPKPIRENNSIPFQPQQFNLLGDTYPGYSTFRNLGFRKGLKSLQLAITYQNELDQRKRAQALNSGRANLILTTLDEFIKHAPKGKIVALLDWNQGHAIVINSKQYPNIKTLNDLKYLSDRRREVQQSISISLPQDAPSEYLALELSQKSGVFDLADYNVQKSVNSAQSWRQMQQEEIALSVLSEPLVSRARQQGYPVLLSKRNSTSQLPNVIVASDSLISENPEAISRLLQNYYGWVESSFLDSTALRQQIADDYRISETEAATVLQGIHLFSSLEAQKWMNQGKLSKQITATAVTLRLSGRLAKLPPNPNDLYTSRFLSAASQKTQELVDKLREVEKTHLAERLSGTDNASVEPIRTASSTSRLCGEYKCLDLTFYSKAKL
jgi:OmpA-OmpF porin, OOP family